MDPPGRVAWMACAIDSCVPTHSSTESAPTPFVNSLDARDALVSALGHNVSRAKLARQRLPRCVTAHRDDSLGTHLLRREHAEQPDRSIAHYDDRRTRLHVRRIGCEPPGTEYVRHRQKTGDLIRGGELLRRDQRAIRHRHPEERRLRTD